MSAFARTVDDFARGQGRFAVGAPPDRRSRALIAMVIVFGVFYGAVMASFSGLAPGRFHQLLYVGVKVPFLLLVTFALCVPSFFVINTVAGLRQDFREALDAVVATQACVTLVLAALAPITALCYVTSDNYNLAVLFNGLMFAVASFSAQIVMRRYYGPLIRRDRRHRLMLALWLALYVFVGIQMAWVLRPFIGDPNQPVAFLRRGTRWGNAYLVVGRLVWDYAGGLMR